MLSNHADKAIHACAANTNANANPKTKTQQQSSKLKPYTKRNISLLQASTTKS